jgi:hypothetical protein
VGFGEVGAEICRGAETGDGFGEALVAIGVVVSGGGGGFGEDCAEVAAPFGGAGGELDRAAEESDGLLVLALGVGDQAEEVDGGCVDRVTVEDLAAEIRSDFRASSLLVTLGEDQGIRRRDGSRAEDHGGAGCDRYVTGQPWSGPALTAKGWARDALWL